MRPICMHAYTHTHTDTHIHTHTQSFMSKTQLSLDGIYHLQITVSPLKGSSQGEYLIATQETLISTDVASLDQHLLCSD